MSVRFFFTPRFDHSALPASSRHGPIAPVTGETRSSVAQSDSVKLDTRHWSASLRAAINHLRVNEEPSSD